MTTQVLKSIAFGVLLGAALFFVPFFLLRVFLFILIVGAIVRFFVGRRFRGGWSHGGHLSFADRIRSMTDEEYNAFKQKNQNGCQPQEAK